MASLFWVGTLDATFDGITPIFATTSGGVATVAAVTSSDDVSLDSNSPAKTLTIGATFSCNTLTINKSGATVACDGSHGITSVGAVTLTAGTLNTNGQTCSWGTFSSSNSNTRTLTLGASAITLTSSGTDGVACNNTASMTVTANTATITIPNNSGFNSTGSFNWNGLSLVITGPLAPPGSTTNARLIGPFTIANLTITGGASKVACLNLLSDITVTGTVTLGGNTTQGVNRLLLDSSVVGTSRKITAAAYVITGDVDFMDINLAYSSGASWTNGGSAFIGDCGGNSGAVTTNATVSATQTATGTASFTWSTYGWTSRVPLPQDDVSIPNAFVAGRTVTQDMPRAGRTITFSCTGSPTLAYGSLGWSLFGSLTLVAGMGFTGTGAFNFRGRGSYTLTSATVTIPATFVVLAPGGTLTLADDLNVTGQVSVQAGTFASGGKNVTTATGLNVFIGGTSAGIVDLGNGGTWTLTGTGAIWTFASLWTLQNVSGTIIDVTNTSGTAKTFAGGGKTYGTLRHIATGSAGLTITGSNTFATLDLECTTARTVTLPASGTQTVTDQLTLKGASGQNLSLVSSTPSTTTALTLRAGSYNRNTFISLSGDIVLTIPKGRRMLMGFGQ